MKEENQALIALYIVVGMGIILLGFLYAPFALGTTIEKEITVIFNDRNGILDSCGNFYYSTDMSSTTRTKFNMLMTEMDANAKPVIVKVIMREPSKNIPISSKLARPYILDVPNVFPTPGECNGN